MEIGRICIKIAGRDAGLKCVVVDVLDDVYVMIDGQTRRRKCNLAHLEPTKEIISISKGDTHDKVVAAFKKLNIEIKERKAKPKTERPKKQRKVKEKPVKEKKAPKKEEPAEKKAEPVKEEPKEEKKVEPEKSAEAKK